MNEGANNSINITDPQYTTDAGYFGLSGNSCMRALFHFSGGSGHGNAD